MSDLLEELIELSERIEEDPEISSEEVLSYIQHGIDINEPVDEGGEGLLCLAILRNRLDIVKILVDSGASLEALLDGNLGPLEIAAGGDLEIFDYLAPLVSPEQRRLATVELPEGIKRQASQTFDQGVKYLWNLIDEIQSDYLESIRQIITSDVSLNEYTESGGTYLWLSVFHSHMNSVRELIHAGADVNLPIRTDRWTPLMIAACTHKFWELGTTEAWGEPWSNQLHIAQLLLESGANINATSLDGQTALIVATISRDLEMIAMLLLNGADPNQQDNGGKKALDYLEDPVEDTQHLETTDQYRELLKVPADYSEQQSQTFFCRTVLGHTDKLNEMLLFETSSLTKNIALRIASSSRGRVDVVKLLIEAGADINTIDDHWRTPLMLSANLGYKDIVETLIEAGADIYLEDQKRKTALKYAKQADHSEIAQILKALTST